MEERRGKGSPSSLASCGRANSAPSNDSGHVSAEPCSLPSVSSTKEMSISSSPPLDLDAAEDLTAEEGVLSPAEFTKVTKKQRKKRQCGAGQTGQELPSGKRLRGGEQEQGGAASPRWRRHGE